jgi:predicted dehydrogenase
MRRWKVGIIGAGRIAGGFDEPGRLNDQKVFTHAGAYRLHGDFELDSVYDLDPKAAREFSLKWNVPHLHSEVRSFFSRPLDVISVCTPDATHFEWTKRALECESVKVVFVEKPVASDLREIDELIELSRSKGKTVVVNYQREFDMDLHRALEPIRAGRQEWLLARGCYYKGLSHIGSTLLQMILSSVGTPAAVWSFQKNLNKVIREESYDFVLYYDGGKQVVVSSLDKGEKDYYYHIFDLEFFLSDRRLAFTYNTRRMVTVPISDYDYSGVKILDERNPQMRETGYDRSFLGAVECVARFASSEAERSDEFLKQSYNVRLLVEMIEKSNRENKKITIEGSQWKK